jgi:twitching motility protein PilT
LNEINKSRNAHIVTIEDPVEYLLKPEKSIISQRELGGDTNDFPPALRSCLRQDPNIVFIGEMRDLDSIQSALTIAETGHLVFSVLHTNSAAQTIDRTNQDSVGVGINGDCIPKAFAGDRRW